MSWRIDALANSTFNLPAIFIFIDDFIKISFIVRNKLYFIVTVDLLFTPTVLV